jgi:hypothetical protein
MAESLQMQYDELKTAYEQKLLAPDLMDAIRRSVNSGMSTEEAEKIIDMYESRMTPEMIENFWNAVREATRFTVDRWLSDGFIDPKQHARITSMYKYYVPLRSWKQTDADKFFSYQSEDVGKSVNPMRKAKGRKSLADDPMQFIVNMAHTAIVMGEKNRIKQHAARLVNENKDMKELHRFKKIYAVWDGTTDPETGKKNYVEVLERPEKEMWDSGMVMMKYDMAHVKGRPKSKAQEHEVDVFIGGEKYTLVLPADVANALNKTPSKWDNAGFVIRDNVGKYTRWLSANFTSKNPAFIVLNQMRDLQYATLAHFIKGDAGQAALFIKNLRKARRTIIQYINGKGDPKDPTYKMYQSFLLNGGETGMVHLKDVDQLARELKLDLARLTGTNSTYDKVIHAKILRDLGGWLEHMAVRSENLSRFATYLAAKERGLTDKEAAFQAKEVTVNFNRKGRISGLMGSMYAFFNASLQGGENILRMGKEHKAKFFAIGAGAMGMGFLTAMLNDLWRGDDDDENDRYSNINDYVKYNNLVVMFPGTKRHVTIPLPHGFRWFHSLGVLAYQTSMMDDKTIAAAVKDGLSNALASVSPINPVELIDKKGSFTSRPLWPTSLVPFYDIAVNETYTGAPVHKEPFTQALNGRIANSSLGMKNVNSWVKGFTDAWFKLGHGDPVSGTKFYEDDSGKIKPVSNIFDVNPSDVEHVIESILGGRGTFWNDLLKTSQGIMESAHQYATEDDSFAQVMRDMDVNSFPVLRSLVRQPWNKTVYSEYYNIVNDIENYKSMVGMKNKALEPDQERGEYAPEYQYKIDLLKDLRKDLKEIDEDIEGVTSPKQISELRDVQERLIRNFIEAVNKHEENR